MWKDNGGIQTYVSNLLGPGKSPTEFYTNPTVIDAYKDYVSQIINRYKDSSAILAWELANEVCLPTSPLTLRLSTLHESADLR